MSTTTIIIIVAIAVILVAIAIISKHSKHKRVFHEEQVASAINEVFDDAGGNEMSRAKFLKMLQLHINCSQKELYYLFGKARSLGMIDTREDMVSLPKK